MQQASWASGFQMNFQSKPGKLLIRNVESESKQQNDNNDGFDDFLDAVAPAASQTTNEKEEDKTKEVEAKKTEDKKEVEEIKKDESVPKENEEEFHFDEENTQAKDPEKKIEDKKMMRTRDCKFK